jgi:hypothetical protein
MRSALLTLVAALVLAGPASAQEQSGAGGAVLPDLEQEAPSGLVVSVAGRAAHARYFLGFRSAVRNVGPGPLVIRGRRSSRRTPGMTATQVISRADGTVEEVPDAGRLRYVVSPGHRHWHLLGFDRYTLRRADGGRTVRRDRKTGFCLGDRYRTAAPLAGASPATPAFTSSCGLGQPGRLGVTEGISVGYGDDYAANLEGQLLLLTGLGDGRYTLAHEVNADRRLRETRYDNNAASLLLDLRWRGGMPHVRVIGTAARVARAGARTFYCHIGAKRPTR